ncbi:hypothetical protein [Clostridium intestinale]|uniref:Uncharacterized protein n=1 Tax=Clostridium intestinale TaxID=36845 RepID=A0A7D6VRG0_9CLOT|nr:hypothetical protein [Clostridium intestinale]QLY77830.1 hypothetical protein HZF06_11980 [Clostridium intestinale]
MIGNLKNKDAYKLMQITISNYTTGCNSLECAEKSVKQFKEGKINE